MDVENVLAEARRMSGESRATILDKHGLSGRGRGADGSKQLLISAGDGHCEVEGE